MKASRMLPFLFFLGLTQVAWGQIPRTISYQGVLRDATSGDLLDGAFAVQFLLWDAATGGALVWSETQSVAVTDGLFKVSLGSGAATFAAVGVTFDQQYWLGIKVGTDPEMIPRIPLESAPYSLAAESVVGTGNVFTSSGRVGIGTTTPVAKLEIASPDLDGIRLADSLSGIRRIWLINAEALGGAINLYDASGVIQAKIRGYDPGTGVQAFFTAGNVGIGTTTPTEKLEVSGNILINDTDLYLKGDGLHGLGWYGTGKTFGGVDVDGPMVYGFGGGGLGTNDGSLQNVALFWNQAGNVGIGTTGPGYTLDVQANAVNDYVAAITNTGTGAGGGKGLLISTDIGAAGAGDLLAVEGSGASLFKVTKSGNVGIGATNPGYALEVAGDVKANSVVLPTTTRWYAIPAVEFMPSQSFYSYTQLFDSTYSTSTGTDVSFFAPVHLPHNATITEFQAVIADTGIGNVTVELASVTFAGVKTTIWTLTSSMTGTQTLTYSSLTAVVDNLNSKYMIRAAWQTPGFGTYQPKDANIQGARVSYTVTSPLP